MIAWWRLLVAFFGGQFIGMIITAILSMSKQVEDMEKFITMGKKKIEWQKPELISLGSADSVAKALLTKGNEILCHDCFTGKKAGLTCYKGVGVK